VISNNSISLVNNVKQHLHSMNTNNTESNNSASSQNSPSLPSNIHSSQSTEDKLKNIVGAEDKIIQSLTKLETFLETFPQKSESNTQNDDTSTAQKSYLQHPSGTQPLNPLARPLNPFQTPSEVKPFDPLYPSSGISGEVLLNPIYPITNKAGPYPGAENFTDGTSTEGANQESLDDGGEDGNGLIPDNASVNKEKGRSIMDRAEEGSKAGDSSVAHRKFGSNPEESQNTNTSNNTNDSKPELKITFAEKKWEGQADLARVKAEGEAKVGDVNMSGSAEAGVGAKAEAGGSITNDGIKGSAGVSVGADASAEGSVSYGIAEAGGSARAFVGAEAGVEGSIDRDGIHAGGEVFAGAKAEGEAHIDVGGVGGGVTGEAWAGAGAAADVDIGMEDGEIVLGGEFGVAYGVGGKIGGEVTIDPDKVVDSAQQAGEIAGDAMNTAKDKAGDTANAVKDTATDAANAVKDRADDAMDTAKKVANKINPFA
jgi:hypothetical protein